MFKKCKCGGLKCKLGGIVWLLALLALILGWLSRGNVLGIWRMDYLGWLLVSIALSALSLPCFLFKGHHGDGKACCGCGCEKGDCERDENCKGGVCK